MIRTRVPGGELGPARDPFAVAVPHPAARRARSPGLTMRGLADQPRAAPVHQRVGALDRPVAQECAARKTRRSATGTRSRRSAAARRQVEHAGQHAGGDRRQRQPDQVDARAPASRARRAPARASSQTQCASMPSSQSISAVAAGVAGPRNRGALARARQRACRCQPSRRGRRAVALADRPRATSSPMPASEPISWVASTGNRIVLALGLVANLPIALVYSWAMK